MADMTISACEGGELQHSPADYDAWFRRKVQAAVDAADAGEFISSEDIEAEFSILREDARKSLWR